MHKVSDLVFERYDAQLFGIEGGQARVWTAGHFVKPVKRTKA